MSYGDILAWQQFLSMKASNAPPEHAEEGAIVNIC